MFSPRQARRSLKRYRQKGLDDLERGMLRSASADGLHGARVLEIGGGIGAIQLELLEAGAAQGEIVELVPAYEEYARQLAREHGLEDRVSYRVEDVLDEPDSVGPADIVVLNRVVCCSPDGIELTGAAARLARRTLLLSFPRDRLLVRIGLALMNGSLRLLGRSFRVFVHAPSSLVGAAEAEGLRLSDTGRGFLWEFVALQRSA
jgi:magnesium-protoporphyrin O-methyltransferase